MLDFLKKTLLLCIIISNTQYFLISMRAKKTKNLVRTKHSHKMKHFTLISLLLIGFCMEALANLTIYKNGASLITGTWQNNGTLSETATNSPYEGNQHYQFAYNFSSYWAGTGLNMDNWGSGAPINFSGNTHLRIAYRGLSGDNRLRIMIRNGSIESNVVEIGASTASYQVVEIPITSLTIGTSINLTAIREVVVSVTSNTASGSGTVFYDAIELINQSAQPPATGSATAFARSASLGNGFNTANWLEAFWLQGTTYPVFNDFTRSKFQFLRNAGFNHVRLPVMFERLGSTTPPYTLNTSHTAFQLVDSAITWANAFNFKLIIDNHHGLPLTDANYLTETPRLCKVWKQLVQRYGNLDPNRFLFELYNEPNGITNANFRTVAQTIMDTVRQYNTTHTFIIGGNGWNSASGLVTFEPINDANVIYTFHNYEPFAFTHQGLSWTTPAYMPARAFPIGNDVADMQNLFSSVQQWATTYQFPVYLGELAVSSTAGAASRCNWIALVTQLANSNNFPWAYWDVKNWNDAFGIFTGGVLSEANVVPCFAQAMGLFQSPLAVSEIQNFRIICENNDKLQFRWSAQTRQIAGDFTIEGSENGQTWIEKYRVAGDLDKSEYDASVKIANNTSNYYRLRYSDGNGEQVYSPIQTADCRGNGNLLVYPNPTSIEKPTSVRFYSPKATTATLTMFDLMGRNIQQQTLEISEGTNDAPLNLPTSLAAGIYRAHLTTTEGQQFSVKLAVQ